MMPFMRALSVMEVGRVDVKLAGATAAVKWPGRRGAGREDDDGAPGRDRSCDLRIGSPFQAIFGGLALWHSVPFGAS